MRDACTNLGAQALATTIKGYWRERGYDVAVDVIPLTILGADHFVVRSDLRNGWPQRAVGRRQPADAVRLATAALFERIAFSSPS